MYKNQTKLITLIGFFRLNQMENSLERNAAYIIKLNQTKIVTVVYFLLFREHVKLRIEMLLYTYICIYAINYLTS